MNYKKFFLKKNSLKKNQKDIKIIYEPSPEYKEIIINHAYLGKKGYTIPKNILEKEDHEFLRKDLFVKPEVNGINYGAATEDSYFPVFRENENKIYLPRFYGIDRYGEPIKNEIQDGDNISVQFDKPLRDYQEDIINVYINNVKSQSINGGGGILDVYAGSGKTIMSLKIVSILSKKTLIIVHKEFLLNQWIERIEEFLPTAKVGKIQGPIIDIEGKDIVIGMVQTLYDREFPPNTFTSFGLTIIDEVHRIGSEQFSKTLFKTITPYMLGISATVERKDNLTKILYMFIGKKIYSIKRDTDDIVNVRGIYYITNDNEFNETETDYRGNPKYSTMITKLCDYGPRSDFIIRVIRDLLEEEPEKQMMILCHNRSLLTYLFEGITHRNFATIGYYVGGMKQDKLKETEVKQIVLATYAMAAEALDIKTLSTLVMITPKTEITQAVGRILRAKHENPIIVDIIDKHDIFKNQWTQRKRYYKKCNYRIWETESTKYTNMNMNWKDSLQNTVWKKTFEPKINVIKNMELPTEEENDDTNSKENLYQGKCLINTSIF